MRCGWWALTGATFPKQEIEHSNNYYDESRNGTSSCAGERKERDNITNIQEL